MTTADQLVAAQEETRRPWGVREALEKWYRTRDPNEEYDKHDFFYAGWAAARAAAPTENRGNHER